MSPSHIELKLVLAEAGISNIDLASFSQRFNIQKRVYLTQLMGCDLGYRFGWYLRGPYSRDLTADAFALKDELAAGEKDHEQFKLPEESIEKVNKAKALWAIPQQLGVSSDQWLELLASLHYLKHIAYRPKDADRSFEAIFSSLIVTKPQFTNRKNDARSAWARLEEMGLLSAKTLA